MKNFKVLLTQGLTISLVVSLLIHLFVILDGPKHLYKFFKEIQFTQEEIIKMESINTAIQSIESKPSVSKDMVKQARELRESKEEAFNEYKKDMSRSTIQKINQANQKYREYIGMMEESFSKFTDEEKQALKNALEGELVKLAKNAEERTFGGNSNFERFINKENKNSNKTETDLTQKESSNKIQITILSQQEFDSMKNNEPSVEKDTIECDPANKYYGIGVSYGNVPYYEERHNNGWWKIDSVGKGYGAYNAGVRSGDVILGYYSPNGEFIEGTNLIHNNKNYLNKRLTFIVKRGQDTFKKEILISEICYLPN